MRLSWFSPLPPAQTAVAQYTASLLPTLCRQAEVTLWTDQTTWDVQVEEYATVRRYEPAGVQWAELNRTDMSVYHIGNSQFHRAIWRVSREAPGIVVLHEARLQDLLRTLPSAYIAERHPFTPSAISGALGVVVHTRQSYLTVKRSSECPLAHAALPYPVAAPVPRRASAPPYRIILFGYIGWNRRLNEVLKALALFAEHGRLRLDVYGQLYNAEDARARIRALGLDGLVTLHGFVPARQLDAALANAHLAINLRSPTMGEASFSQLQIWAHGLPSLVTPAGWYATLPAEAVAFVRPQREQADLHAHWQALLADPERFARMGEAGRRHLEAHHTPVAYARTIVELAVEATRFRAAAAARQLADRAATLMSLWLAPSASPEVFRPAATSIAALASPGHDVDA